jgi:hypothetical protein
VHIVEDLGLLARLPDQLDLAFQQQFLRFGAVWLAAQEVFQRRAGCGVLSPLDQHSAG